MNRPSFFLAGNRRVWLSVCFFAASLLACSSRAELQICGCEKKGKYTWQEHLTHYSNMVYYVQQARECYAKAVGAAKTVRADWQALGKEWDDASKVKGGIEESGNIGRELQSQIAGYVARENNKAIGQLKSKVEEYLGKVKESKEAWKALDVDAFIDIAGGKVREEDGHWGEFTDSRRRFDDPWYDKADKEYYTAISLPCLKREFEALKPLKDELSILAESLQQERNKAFELRQSLVKTRGAADAAFKDCEAWTAGIARSLELPPDAGDKEIVEKIVEAGVDKVLVRFRNVKTPIDPQELRSGMDEPTEPESPFVSDGPKFRYWRERSTDAEFRQWKEKISRNLELEAVWGYEVHVSGIEAPLMYPVERWDDTLPCSRVLGSEQLKECAEKLRAAKEVGYVFKGWASAADPDALLTERSGNIRTGATLQPIWETAEYLITYVVPGGTPPPVTKWQYQPAGPFPVPPGLPAPTNGYTYVRWSLEPNGAEPWMGGVAITNNLTVYAVREADFRVVFHDEDGSVLKTLGAKKGEAFEIPGDIVSARFKAGNSTFDKGRVFSGRWRPQGQGTNITFTGGMLTGNVDVYAIYSDESVEDVVRRNLQPIEKRASLPVVAIADVALLVVLAALLFTGGGPRKPKVAKESVPAEGESASAPAETSASADNGEPQSGESSAS